jgi:hypothetical protein
LGEALSVLREKHNIPHREWMKYVDDLGINYTRAKRALRIKQRYEKPEDCYGKSIDDALDYEQREEHHQTPTPKPVGAKPAMHFQHDEHQEEEEIESTDENEDENESHNPAIADIESIHKDGDYEPIVADLTPEEIGAATNFIAVVGNCERAAHALVTKCIENGDRKIVIGFFETVVQSLRSALEWSDIDQILITTKAKEHGVKVITL